MPLIWTESADEEEDNTDANVGKDDAHPDLVGQWIHEREDAGRLLGALLDHDADAETHERLGEVNDTLSDGGDGQGGNGKVGLLLHTQTHTSHTHTFSALVPVSY